MTNTNVESPHFSSACGTTGRVVAARIYPNLDIIKTLEEICIQHNIQYGQITTTIGSLRRVKLHYVDRTEPTKGKGYIEHLEKEGPFSVLSGQGLVSQGDEPNTMNIHYHAVVSGEDDIIYGGHIEEGTISLTTMDVFILELHGIEISRTKDMSIGKEGVVVTSFKEI
jgi:predicted DNA-binding protein with PD1-like motif